MCVYERKVGNWEIWGQEKVKKRLLIIRDRTKARHSDSKGELRKEKRKMTPQKSQPNGRGERVREGRGDRLVSIQIRGPAISRA